MKAVNCKESQCALKIFVLAWPGLAGGSPGLGPLCFLFFSLFRFRPALPWGLVLAVSGGLPGGCGLFLVKV